MAPSPRRRLAFACLLLSLSLPAVALAGKGATGERGLDWGQLTTEQQHILAPLADEWPKIEGPRRAKWIEIAKRYPKLTPQQQARLQSQMKQWASITPEQRTQVRDRHKKFKEMPPEKREAIVRRWKEYEALTEEEKKSLRQAHQPRPAPASGKL